MDILQWLDARENPPKGRIKPEYIPHIAVGAVALLTLFWAVIYTLMSKTVYFWDSATYWEISVALANKPINLGLFKEIYQSIIASDYNYLPAIPVSVWMRIFGTTRISYITAITLMYLIPSQIMIYALCRRLSKAPYVVFLLSILLVPSLSYLTIIGFIDVGGVLLGLLCYYLYYGDSFRARPWLKYVLIGVLLTIMMLYRRYFAFFAVSFMTAMIIDAILFKRSWRGVVLTAVSLGGVLVIFFFPFIVNILLKDYSNLYAGYKYDIFTDLKLITRYFGILGILVTLFLGLYAISRKKDFRCIFPLLQILVCTAMFISTQTHGQQHLLLYIPGIITIFIMCMNSINRHGVLIGVCTAVILTSLSPIIPRVQPNNIQDIKGLAFLPTYSVEPEKRGDINHILALKRDLDGVIPEGKYCGVLASSFKLNASVLINVEPSLNKKTQRGSYITGLPEVDSRDFWRLEEIYTSDYILVATPAQTHLKTGEQTIIEQAVASFENNTDIAGFFVKENGFDRRIDGMDLSLYRRVGDVSETAKAEFEKRLELE